MRHYAALPLDRMTHEEVRNYVREVLGSVTSSQERVEVVIDLGLEADEGEEEYVRALQERATGLGLPHKRAGSGALLRRDSSAQMDFFVDAFLFSPEEYVDVAGRRLLDGIDAGTAVLVHDSVVENHPIPPGSRPW